MDRMHRMGGGVLPLRQVLERPRTLVSALTRSRIILWTDFATDSSPLEGEDEGGGAESSPHPNLPPPGGKGMCCWWYTVGAC